LWYYRKIVIHPEDLVLDNTGPYTLAYDSIDEAIIVCERMKEGNTSYYPPDYEPVKENQ
jgi:hypothetical protein